MILKNTAKNINQVNQLLFFLLLFWCVAISAQEGDIKAVTIEETARYWVLDEEQANQRNSFYGKHYNSIEGFVEAMRTINAEGKVIDIEIIDAKPRRFFDREAISALLKLEYRPADDNVDRVPVRGLTRIDFIKDPTDKLLLNGPLYFGPELNSDHWLIKKEPVTVFRKRRIHDDRFFNYSLSYLGYNGLNRDGVSVHIELSKDLKSHTKNQFEYDDQLIEGSSGDKYKRFYDCAHIHEGVHNRGYGFGSGCGPGLKVYELNWREHQYKVKLKLSSRLTTPQLENYPELQQLIETINIRPLPSSLMIQIH